MSYRGGIAIESGYRWRVQGWDRVLSGIAERVDFGAARLVPDPRRKGGWTLLIEEVQQSYVDVADPTYLGFEYMRRLATVIDAVAPAAAPLRVLHLGGGALTLPRYVAATRSGSEQVVIERDRRLVALVERVLPMPAEARPRIEIGDVVDVLAGLDDGGFDLAIGDVYHAARMPESVTSTGFMAQVARVLGPRGVYAVNVADLAPLILSREQAVTLRSVFDDVCMIVRPELLRGRRYGNVVFAAAKSDGVLPVARLARAAARDPQPGRVAHGEPLDRLTRGVG